MFYEGILIITLLFIAVNTAIVGSFLLLHKMSMLVDALAHSILPGIVLAYIIAGVEASVVNFLWVLLFAIFTVLLIQGIQKIKTIQNDVALGIVYTFLFALGVILLNFFSDKSPLDTDSVLFGELSYLPFDAGVYIHQVKIPWITIAVILLFITLLVLVPKLKKHWIILSFDPQFAAAIGLKVFFWKSILMLISTFVVVICFKAIGAVLLINYTVAPAILALLLSKQINQFLLLSVVFSLVNALFGYLVAYQLDLNIAATSAFFSLLLVLLIIIVKQIRYKFA